MRPMLLLGLSLAVMGVAAPAASAATGVATLDGEILSASAPGGGPNQQVHFRVRCAPDGSGTISWTAQGAATGPYTGTFTESGAAKWGAPSAGSEDGTLEEFSATFHIDSPTGDVDGRKFITEPVFGLGYPGAYGLCIDNPDNPIAGEVVNGAAHYEAVIKPATGGAFADEGETSADALASGGITLNNVEVERTAGFVGESFVSDLTEARALLPSAKEQCKDKGFQIFGVFENQGDCVSFVTTHGKNEPSQNLPGVP